MTYVYYRGKRIAYSSIKPDGISYVTVEEFVPQNNMEYRLDFDSNAVIAIEKTPVLPEEKPMDVKAEVKLLQAKNEAQTQTIEFLEDCIAEMAQIVYE